MMCRGSRTSSVFSVPAFGYDDEIEEFARGMVWSAPRARRECPRESSSYASPRLYHCLLSLSPIAPLSPIQSPLKLVPFDSSPPKLAFDIRTSLTAPTSAPQQLIKAKTPGLRWVLRQPPNIHFSSLNLGVVCHARRKSS